MRVTILVVVSKVTKSAADRVAAGPQDYLKYGEVGRVAVQDRLAS